MNPLASLTSIVGRSTIDGVASYLGDSIQLSSGSASLSAMLTNPHNPLEGAQRRPDPIFNHDWYIEMPGNDFGAGPATSNALGSIIGDSLGTFGDMAAGAVGQAVTEGISTFTGLPWYYVEEATLPTRNFDVRSVFRNGHHQHYPGNYSVSPMRVTVYADAEGRALSYLNAWHQMVMRKFTSRTPHLSGSFNPPAWLKRNITAVLLSSDKKQVAFITYVGCWITDLGEFNLGSAGNERLVFNANIQVDDVFVEVTGLKGLIDTFTPQQIF